MNDYMDEPRRSGTVLKVVLIIITIIAVVAAVAMGLLFYNAKSSVDSFRERNDALSDELKKAQAQLAHGAGGLRTADHQPDPAASGCPGAAGTDGPAGERPG